MSTFEISILVLLLITLCVSLFISVLLNDSAKDQSSTRSNSYLILQELKHMNNQIFKQEHSDNMRIANLERELRDIRDDARDYISNANRYFTEHKQSFKKLEESSELSSLVLTDVRKELFRM